MNKFVKVLFVLVLAGCNGSSCVPTPDQIKACKEACAPHGVSTIRTDVGCLCNNF